MRYKELIKEVPISDIQPMGDPDPEIDQDYSDPDEGMPAAWTDAEKRDVLSDTPKAKKWRQKVIQSWSKTKNNYLIIPVFGEDAYNYEIVERGIVSIQDLKEDFEEGYKFLHQLEVLEDGYTSYEDVVRTEKHADKTIIFFLGNGADQWVRASGWMMLHRLGHASRTHMSKVNPAYARGVTLMFEQLQETFANYGIDLWLKKDDNIEAKVPSKANTQLWADYLLTKIMTTKSARTGNLRDRYEAFYEMWAQYLNRGAMKLRVPDTLDIESSTKPNTNDEQEMMPGDKQIIGQDLERMEEIMNTEAFPLMEKSIAGEILLM